MALHSTITLIEACAGVRGLGLSLKLVFGERLRTICLIEREAYAQAVNVARMEETEVAPAPEWDLLETFRGRPWRGLVSIFAAGFPCQPFSVAGKQQGTSDERWVWPDIIRIIRESRTPVVWLENVTGLTLSYAVDGKPGWVLPAGLWHVLGDLAASGFDAQWGCIRASSVGASHRRARLFILAYSKEWHREAGNRLRKFAKTREGSESRVAGRSNAVVDASEISSVSGSEQPGRRRAGRSPNEENRGLGESDAAMGDAASNNELRDSDRAHGTRQPPRRSSRQLADSDSRGQSTGRRANPGRSDIDGISDRVVNASIERTRSVPKGQGSSGRRTAIPDRRGAAVGNATGEGHEGCSSERGDPGQEYATVERAGIPLFPPGPGLGGHGVIDDIIKLLERDPDAAWRRYQAELANTINWREALAIDETLEPSIYRMVDELAPRVDRLRATGEGVVPLAAAVAFCALADRLGITELLGIDL